MDNEKYSEKYNITRLNAYLMGIVKADGDFCSRPLVKYINCIGGRNSFLDVLKTHLASDPTSALVSSQKDMASLENPEFVIVTKLCLPYITRSTKASSSQS